MLLEPLESCTAWVAHNNIFVAHIYPLLCFMTLQEEGKELTRTLQGFENLSLLLGLDQGCQLFKVPGTWVEAGTGKGAGPDVLMGEAFFAHIAFY